MRFLRVVAILGIAAGLVAGWTIAQPAVESAGSKLMSAVTTTGPVTYYVRPGGDDAAAGTSPAAAWRTLARARPVRLCGPVRGSCCWAESSTRGAL